ncbi:MAG: hypothetical protein LBK70_01655 [Clostridiales bacterium]|jgi:hypothetical protein|nr:hypothetical protein [Clostridiales bacterium]
MSTLALILGWALCVLGAIAIAICVAVVVIECVKYTRVCRDINNTIKTVKEFEYHIN